jgi:hypothetical protein
LQLLFLKVREHSIYLKRQEESLHFTTSELKPLNNVRDCSSEIICASVLVKHFMRVF